MGPEVYLFNIGGPFGDLQGELHWTLFTYVKLHRLAHSGFHEQNVKLDEYASRFGLTSIEAPANELEEQALIGKCRAMDTLIAEDQDLERSITVINKMYVVLFWALAEQFLGRIFKKFVSLESGSPIDSIKPPYRWDDFKKQYFLKGLNLELVHDYSIANECRVLNNHIKHNPRVSTALAVFPQFASYSGMLIDEVPIDPQKYLNGVSNFLGGLIEKANMINSPA